MANIDLDELERLAKAATPGPWKAKENPRVRGRLQILLEGYSQTAWIGTGFDEQANADSSYIAAMHPGTTLALIERIRELESQIRTQVKVDDAAEFAVKMDSVDMDIEAAHMEMDDLLCDKLRELGYGEAVDIFKKTPRWYS